jgi:heterodisulfide reductase subunit B
MLMKKYALFPGCIMPTEQYGYELSIRQVLPMLDVALVDLEGFSCCGEPMKSVNKVLTLYLAARNLALAEQHKLDLYIPCPMCHFSLSECQHILKNNAQMRTRITEMLQEENLNYTGSSSLIHTMDLLHDIIGIESIKNHVKKPLNAWTIATHYGCHLIRPSEIGRPDDSENPQKMENILKALGAKPKYYPEKLDCCGAPILVNLPESALTKTGQKLQRIQEQSFDAMVDVCPWCHKMFDSRQSKAGETVATKLEVPVLYLTQAIGLAFGIDQEQLGMQLNKSSFEKLLLNKK